MDPSWRDKQTVQNTFDESTMALLERGEALPATAVFVEKGITGAEIVAGLQKRYAPIPISRSAAVPGATLNLATNLVPEEKPKPAAKLDGFGNPRLTLGFTVRSAVRATMGLS